MSSTRPWENKGWTVCHNLKRGKSLYNVILKHHDGRREYMLCRHDRIEAIECAITLAAKHGTLNWAATRAWGEKYGIPISYESAMADVSYVPLDSRRRKGWYVQTSSYKSIIDGQVKRVRNYVISFGAKLTESGKMDGRGVYQATRPSMVSGIKYALNRKHENPDYNEEMSINWLISKGYEDLVPMARMQRRGVA